MREAPPVSELGAVHDALLDDAHVRALALTRAASGRAAETVAEAHARAEGLVAARRDAGRRAAAARAVRLRADALRAARAGELAARRALLAGLRDEIAERAQELWARGGEDALRAGVERRARAVLANGAEPSVRPVAGGGFVAEAGTRRLDYSLARLVERCMEDLGPEVEALWS